MLDEQWKHQKVKHGIGGAEAYNWNRSATLPDLARPGILKRYWPMLQFHLESATSTLTCQSFDISPSTKPSIDSLEMEGRR
jgi:hypothetical protein